MIAANTVAHQPCQSGQNDAEEVLGVSGVLRGPKRYLERNWHFEIDEGIFTTEELFNRLAAPIDEALHKGSPTEVTERWRATFNLARHLLAVSGFREAVEAGDIDIEELIALWTEEIGHLIAHGMDGHEHMLSDFLTGMDAVRIPAGQNALEYAFTHGQSVKLPKRLAAFSKDTPYRRIAGACYVLQELAGDQPFYLAYSSAGKMSAIHPDHAGKVLRSLRKWGVIELAQAFPRAKRRAHRYRYRGERQDD